ncbi:ABC transporter substrate-binding protein, partial [Rhizobiaceae sp. 2RAB30]
AAHAYLNYVLDAKVQQDMAKAFFTSPSNSESVVEGDLAKRIPIVGPRMSEIKSYDWNGYVDKSAEIADRWNREMA